jgi:hypothetical protein
MAITIINKEFTYLDGSQKTFYEANAGDRIEIKFKILEQILVASGGSNFLSFNLFDNTINWSGGSWLIEGFRVGESYQLRKYDSAGNPIGGATQQTVIAISGTNNNIIKFNDINPSVVPNLTNGEIVVIYQATDYRREEIITYANHVQSNNAGNEFSLIDGEATGFRIDITQIPGYPYAIPNGYTAPFTPVGKHSGQFATNCELIFSNETPTSAGFQINVGFIYYIKFTVIQSGIYDPSQFVQNFCLKFYAKMQFARFVGEPFERNQLIFNDEANTGWYDEPYNVGFSDAVLVQGITEIGYDAPTNAQIIINTPTAVTDIGLGFSYIPGDEDYYKNQIPDQSVYGMTIPTTPTFALNNFVSPTNPDGANYTVNVTNVTNFSGVVTIDLTITPNPAFDAFMTGREVGDQTFYVWAKVGSVNLLVFNGQLTSNPPIGGPLQLETAGYYDHKQNIDSVTATVENGYEANVEDDLAFVGSFLLNLNDICETFLARIEAYNTVTDEAFTLAQTFFNFAGVPQIAGKYILNQTSNVYSILPNTSLKKDAKFVLEPSLDTPTKYGVKIFFPFIYRWEYWLQQANANNDFYPNDQTKNWVPYGNTGDWTLRLHLELNKAGLGYVYDDNVIIKDYDSDPDIKQTIELYINATNQLANIVTIGQLMRVETTHELIDGQFWETPSVWGQITVEPKESATRYLLSTTVPFDNNINNPLNPISGSFAQLTFPTPSVAKIVCLFDPGKIDLTNGCKFTTKIKGCTTDVLAFGKVTTEDEPKVTTDDILKEIS